MALCISWYRSISVCHTRLRNLTSFDTLLETQSAEAQPSVVSRCQPGPHSGTIGLRMIAEEPDLRSLLTGILEVSWSFYDTPTDRMWQRSCIIMVECTSILICTLFALQLLWPQVAKVQHFPVDVDGISRISLFGTWLRTDLNRKTKRFRCCFECGYYPVSWTLASDYYSPRACYHSIDARLTVKDVDDIALCLAMWSALNKYYGDCFAYVLGFERAETTRETNIRQFYDVLWQATYSCNQGREGKGIRFGLLQWRARWWRLQGLLCLNQTANMRLASSMLRFYDNSPAWWSWWDSNA